MSTTQANNPQPTGEDIFNHVMDTVLNRDDNSRLKKALVAAGVGDIGSLSALRNTDIDAIKYDENRRPLLNLGDANLLKLIGCYRCYQSLLGQPMTDDYDWVNVTKREFDTFRTLQIDDYDQRVAAAAPAPAPASAALSGTAGTATNSSAPASVAYATYTPEVWFKLVPYSINDDDNNDDNDDDLQADLSDVEDASPSPDFSLAPQLDGFSGDVGVGSPVVYKHYSTVVLVECKNGEILKTFGISGTDDLVSCGKKNSPTVPPTLLGKLLVTNPDINAVNQHCHSGTGRPDHIMKPKQCWFHLQQEVLWDKFSEKDLAIILSHSQDMIPIHQRPPDPHSLWQTRLISKTCGFFFCIFYLF